MLGARIPGPGEPRGPEFPIMPGWPSAPAPTPDPVPPTRVWLDPHADWKGKLYERLLEKRIVLASGLLDDDAASRLSAQLLTLDAEGTGPIRLELQNLSAELSATLTVMGILDVMRVPVHALVSGEIAGPALGLLASCPQRSGYPNASFTLSEPKLRFGGTVTALTAREQQVTRMLDTLYFKLADVTGREVDEIREDARRGRSLTTAQAIGYGLIQNQETGSPIPQSGDIRLTGVGPGEIRDCARLAFPEPRFLRRPGALRRPSVRSGWGTGCWCVYWDTRGRVAEAGRGHGGGAERVTGRRCRAQARQVG
jgi:ATP-dependent Clp protease protease subunit